MPGVCKHGLDERFCDPCQRARETEPLRSDALRVTRKGNPLLVLRTILGSQNVKALMLDGNTVIFATVEESTLRVLDSTISFNRQKVLDQFLHLALQRGYLFQPEHELTYRERTEEGPSRCYFDHTELSQKKCSLGCTQCRYYVCQCGRCLCGYTGMNYLGQVFSQLPELPISRENRLEFIRVVKFCKLVFKA